MKKIITLLCIIFCHSVAAQPLKKITYVPNQISFKVEVAATRAEQTLGLGYRAKLPADQGMIFVYSQPQIVTMWMKGCTIPLDILFLDSSGKIIYIQENTVPLSLKHIISPPETKYVLEVNAGSVKKNNIELNEKIDLKEIVSQK